MQQSLSIDKPIKTCSLAWGKIYALILLSLKVSGASMTASFSEWVEI